eukprot:gene15151-biopygen15226
MRYSTKADTAPGRRRYFPRPSTSVYRYIAIEKVTSAVTMNTTAATVITVRMMMNTFLNPSLKIGRTCAFMFRRHFVNAVNQSPKRKTAAAMPMISTAPSYFSRCSGSKSEGWYDVVVKSIVQSPPAAHSAK